MSLRYFPCSNGIIEAGSDVVDHAGEDCKVVAIKYCNGKAVVILQSVLHEDVTVKMNARRVLLKTSKRIDARHADLVQELKHPTDQSWTILSAIKRTIMMAFEKKCGFTQFICNDSALARTLVGLSANEQVIFLNSSMLN